MTTDQEAAWTQIESAAKKEGTLTYYAVGSIPQNKVDLLQETWKQSYPDIKIEYLFVGNNSQVGARVDAEQQSKTYVADVAEMATFNQLQAPQAYFEPFIPPVAKDPSVKWVVGPVGDPAGKGGIMLQMAQFYAIWINTNLVKAEDAPKTVLDVASTPKWKGQIGAEFTLTIFFDSKNRQMAEAR